MNLFHQDENIYFKENNNGTNFEAQKFLKENNQNIITNTSSNTVFKSGEPYFKRKKLEYLSKEKLKKISKKKNNVKLSLRSSDRGFYRKIKKMTHFIK
jgi:hypothetical protein